MEPGNASFVLVVSPRILKVVICVMAPGIVQAVMAAENATGVVAAESFSWCHSSVARSSDFQSEDASSNLAGIMYARVAQLAVGARLRI